MNKHSIWHQAKSHLSYAYDQNTLHILLQVAKGDATSVTLIHGDPFEWKKEIDMKWVHQQQSMEKRYETELYDVFFLAIKPPFKRVKYAFLIQSGQEKYFYGTQGLKSMVNQTLYGTYDLSAYFNYPFLNFEDVMKTPLWAKNMVWYQIFPDRFYTETPNLEWTTDPIQNHDHFGGTLKGVEQKLPYLKELGVNGIYFTPIFEASSMHKYDTIDYFKIDPQFGTNDDFKQLVKKAHESGIKIMLDGVFNHAGFLHPYFQDVVKHGEQSNYKDCFFIHDYPVVNFELNEKGMPKHFPNQPNRFETFGFTPMMPKWNTSHPLVEKHLLDCVAYWIEEYDIDGWRLDVSNEISHDFLRKLRTRARQSKPTIFILGENWDSSLPWLQGDQLDAVMNYDLSVPMWNYLEQKLTPLAFHEQLQAYLARTPKHVIDSMFNLVCSHDTIRIKKRLNDHPLRMKQAYLLMFMHAGAPNIYYGDEVGMTGFHDPNNRKPMIWDEKRVDHEMFTFMKQLIQLRYHYESMRQADYEWISNDTLFIMKKSHAADTLLLMFNTTNETTSHPIDLSDYDTLLSSQDDADKIVAFGYYLGVKR
jgi:cyclomaltodextrinase / maltogenic alpha-amylase / neopullulanase